MSNLSKLDFTEKMPLGEGRFWDAYCHSADFYRMLAAFYVITIYTKEGETYQAVERFAVRVYSSGSYSDSARQCILKELQPLVKTGSTNIPEDIHWRGPLGKDVDKL